MTWVGVRLRRHHWVLVHRCAGLNLAFFLTVAGLTGTILAFDSWIYEWLNPDLSRVQVQDRPVLDGFTLRERALAIEPRARANYVVLNLEPGRVAYYGLDPRIDPATGQPYNLGYTGLYLDPYTGAEVAREADAGLWPITRRNLLSVVFALHTSLACGEVGRWLFGLAAIIWVLDSFVGFYLTLPPRRRRAATRPWWWARWWPSWRFTWRGKAYPVNFNLHRASGLWAWALLFALAASSVAFNLPEVYGPVMRTVFRMPDVKAGLPDLPTPTPDPAIGWREAAAIGERLTAEQARLHGFKVRPAPGTMWFLYDPVKGIFSYPSHCDRDVGYHLVGSTVHFDGRTGEFRAIEFSSGHHAATTFTSWVSAIHTCTVGGVAMHVLVGLAGLVTALLSITGVYLWWKKRSARRLSLRASAVAGPVSRRDSA